MKNKEIILTDEQRKAFEAFGAAVCAGKAASKTKDEQKPVFASVISNNRERFIDGITIGGYRFKLVVREELQAMRV